MVAKPDDFVTGQWLRSLVLSGIDATLFATTALHAPLVPVGVPIRSPLSLRARAESRRMMLETARAPYGRMLDRLVMPRLEARSPDWTARRLARTIVHERPDIVHCLDPWTAAGVVQQCQSHMRSPVPPVVMSVRSDDLRLAAVDPVWQEHLTAALGVCDCCLVEREADRRMVFAEDPAIRVFLFEPLCGSVPEQAQLPPAATSSAEGSRPTIVVDGTRSWLHRPFVALRALQVAARRLSRFRVIVDTADPDVALVARLLGSDTALDVEVVDTSREWAWAGSSLPAEICLSLSLGDSLDWRPLAALCSGATLVCGPVAALKEWAGERLEMLCVPPEDPSAVSRALAAIAGDADQRGRSVSANQSVAAETFGLPAFSSLVHRRYQALLARTT